MNRATIIEKSTQTKLSPSFQFIKSNRIQIHLEKRNEKLIILISERFNQIAKVQIWKISFKKPTITSLGISTAY